MPHSKLLKLPAILFFLLIASTMHSQNSRAFLMEPMFDIVLDDDKSWAYSFGLAHRGVLLEIYDREKIGDYTTEHIEVNHFTRYRISPHSAIALRLRYRFIELFNEAAHDESRIIQEFTHSNPDAFMNLWHRARFEQAFEGEKTSLRGRYRIGIFQPLSPDFSVGASTEALYSVSPNSKPEPEQRFTLSLGNSSFEDLELSVGIEHRLSNYHRNAVREFFLLTSATLYL